MSKQRASISEGKEIHSKIETIFELVHPKQNQQRMDRRAPRTQEGTRQTILPKKSEKRIESQKEYAISNPEKVKE